MGPVGSRCGRPASRGGRVRPGLAGNGEVAARARAPQARVRARRRRPPSQGGHGFSGPHHWNGFSGPRRRNGFGGPRRWNGFSGPHRWRHASRPAPGRTCGGRTHSPAGALAPAQGRTQPARTVLVGRENGTYNVDRARTWLRESGRQVQPPCRGVRQLRGSRPLIGWSPCRYVGVSAGGAEGRGPAGDPPEYDSGWPERCLLVVRPVGEWGGVAHSFWGAGRGGGVVPTVSRPRGTS